MLIHNGIIENYQSLSAHLRSRGYHFTSETDTEVMAHLIDDAYKGDLVHAVKQALGQVTGTYGLVVMHSHHPDQLVAARRGSPMVLGVGDGETFLASDVSAFLRLTDRVVYLEDDDIVSVTTKGFTIDTLAGEQVQRDAEQIEWQDNAADLEGFPHYTLKEIFEQPETITNAIRGRLVEGEGMAHFGGLDDVLEEGLKEAQHLVIISCGTSYYAGLYARYVFEKLTDLTVEVEIASEMRYRKTNIRPGTVVLAISQSGETADTVAAMREAERKGALLLGLVNVVGSTISRMTKAGVYNHGGPEIGVASTKIFTSQCCILAMMALLQGRFNQLVGDGRHGSRQRPPAPARRHQPGPQGSQPHPRHRGKIRTRRQFSVHRPQVQLPHGLGRRPEAQGDFVHSRRGLRRRRDETRLYRHDRRELPHRLPGYPRHDLRENRLQHAGNQEPQRQNYRHCHRRRRRHRDIADDVIYTPATLDFLQPIPAIVALQLFAYYCALERGCEIDQPRNLAKSVTVE